MLQIAALERERQLSNRLAGTDVRLSEAPSMDALDLQLSRTQLQTDALLDALTERQNELGAQLSASGQQLEAQSTASQQQLQAQLAASQQQQREDAATQRQRDLLTRTANTMRAQMEVCPGRVSGLLSEGVGAICA